MKVESAPGDGYGFEVEVCGCSFLQTDPKHRRHQRRIGFQDALRHVVAIQRKLGCNPCRPKTKLAKAMFDRITSRLRLAGNKEPLKFFVCVGTHMDCLGVDCFFRCGNRLVTIDLYSGQMKKKSGQVRADIILRRSDFLSNDYYRVADKIAEMLLA